MKQNLIKKLLLTAAAFAVIPAITSSVYGDVIPMHVMVVDSAGAKAFSGTTDAGGTFGTGELQPGDYTVQFSSHNPGLRPNSYALVIASGVKKVVAVDVPGAKFTTGGVAMRIHVAAGRRVSGQVVDSRSVVSRPEENVRIISGVRYRWERATVGSQLGGRWVEESAAQAFNVQQKNNGWLQKLQDGRDEGSLVTVMTHKMNGR